MWQSHMIVKCYVLKIETFVFECSAALTVGLNHVLGYSSIRCPLLTLLVKLHCRQLSSFPQYDLQMNTTD